MTICCQSDVDDFMMFERCLGCILCNSLCEQLPPFAVAILIIMVLLQQQLLPSSLLRLLNHSSTPLQALAAFNLKYQSIWATNISGKVPGL